MRMEQSGMKSNRTPLMKHWPAPPRLNATLAKAAKADERVYVLVVRGERPIENTKRGGWFVFLISVGWHSRHVRPMGALVTSRVGKRNNIDLGGTDA